MASLRNVLAGILATGKKDQILAQLKGPIVKGPTTIAICAPCTEIQRAANPKYEGVVGWPAKDLERHLREYHLVGQA